jgi:hypothetical protein
LRADDQKCDDNKEKNDGDDPNFFGIESKNGKLFDGRKHTMVLIQ